MSSYPNPASGFINVDILSTSNSDFSIARSRTSDIIYDIKLFDNRGNIVRQERATSGNVQLNVSNLPIGIYYLHIYDNTTETPEIQQIIIER
jgi:hypothetical protein